MSFAFFQCFVLSEVKDYIGLHALPSPLCSMLPAANLRNNSVYTEPLQLMLAVSDTITVAKKEHKVIVFKEMSLKIAIQNTGACSYDTTVSCYDIISHRARD